MTKSPLLLVPSTKEHLTNLINWLLEEVAGAGGDGDAFWITNYYDINEIETLAREILKGDKFWQIIKQNEHDICIGNHMEGLIISDNLDYNIPSWAQCVVKL